MTSIRTVTARVLAAGAATALVAGGPALTSAVAEPDATSRAGPCTHAALDVRAGTVEGAAGTTYRRINFVNTGSSACRLQGWPRVAFRDAAHHRIGRPAARDHTRPAHRVTIGAGEQARASVGVPEPGNFPPPSCQAATASEIRVSPPHRGWSVRLQWTIDVCARPAGRTFVTAVHRGP